MSGTMHVAMGYFKAESYPVYAWPVAAYVGCGPSGLALGNKGALGTSVGTSDSASRRSKSLTRVSRFAGLLDG